MKPQAKSFEDLDCWKHSTTLRRRLAELVKIFPAEEKYRLTDQIIRASRSATSNIAEGYGRFHFQENTQYCRQARGSLYELIDHLLIAADQGYISKEEFTGLKQRRHFLPRTVEWLYQLPSKSKGNEVLSQLIVIPNMCA